MEIFLGVLNSISALSPEKPTLPIPAAAILPAVTEVREVVVVSAEVLAVGSPAEAEVLVAAVSEVGEKGFKIN